MARVPLLFTTLCSLVIILQPDISIPFERAEITATIESSRLRTVDLCPVPEPSAFAALVAGLPLLAERSTVRTATYTSSHGGDRYL